MLMSGPNFVIFAFYLYLVCIIKHVLTVNAVKRDIINKPPY